MINKGIRKEIIKFKKINGRISFIKIKKKITYIFIINVYAPTKPEHPNENEIFYGTLEETCKTILNHDKLMIERDFSAKIGREDILKRCCCKRHNPRKNY